MEWNDFFNQEKDKDYFKRMISFIDEEYKKNKCYPKKEDIFNAFSLCPFSSLKVIIIGQDPYFNENEAMGLAFSVKEGIKLPPSLRNIYKEIENEFNCLLNYESGDLTYLANQGVFLINPILTVREKEPLSHNIKEYDIFFKNLIEFIDNNLNSSYVVMLWGNKAKSYQSCFKSQKANILTSSHPSPLSSSRGNWFNSNIFLKCNEILKNNGLDEINWGNSF